MKKLDKQIIPQTKTIESGTFQIGEDRYCLIPDGEYLVGFDFYRTDHMFRGAPKLEFWFVIIGEDFQGLRLPKWYNATKCQKNRKHGNFTVAKRGNFLMDYARLFHRAIKRRDRVSMSCFEKHYYLVETETVTKNFQQENYPKQLRYSKIKTIKKAIPLKVALKL